MFIISAQEILGVVSKQKEIYRYQHRLSAKMSGKISAKIQYCASLQNTSTSTLEICWNKIAIWFSELKPFKHWNVACSCFCVEKMLKQCLMLDNCKKVDKMLSPSRILRFCDRWIYRKIKQTPQFSQELANFQNCRRFSADFGFRRNP